jgi:hypothetical protein
MSGIWHRAGRKQATVFALCECEGGRPLGHGISASIGTDNSRCLILLALMISQIGGPEAGLQPAGSEQRARRRMQGSFRCFC